MAFWLNGVIYAALLTLAALAPRAVAPCFHLVFKLSTFLAFLPCIYRLFSHIPYYSIIALVWTLPTAGECPNTQLKEVKKGKGDRRAWMSGTIAVLLKPEAVIGPYENS